MHNRRQRDKAKIILLQRDGPHAHTIAAGSFDNVERGQSITPQAHPVAYFGDAGLAPIIGEDHRKTGGATFHCAQLEQGRYAPSPQPLDPRVNLLLQPK